MPAFRLILLLALLLTGTARAQDAPAATVERFLTHQALREYDDMYELLSQRSRELYGREAFLARYEELDTLLQAEALEYRLDSTQLQGHAAAVTYDLTLAGTLFGDIHDPGRTMRLLREAEGWRVAWSAMDIFDGLGGGGSLRAIGRRAPRANIYDRRGQALVTQGGTLLAPLPPPRRSAQRGALPRRAGRDPAAPARRPRHAPGALQPQHGFLRRRGGRGRLQRQRRRPARLLCHPQPAASVAALLARRRHLPRNRQHRPDPRRRTRRPPGAGLSD